jgi:membrane dipeptidase
MDQETIDRKAREARNAGSRVSTLRRRLLLGAGAFALAGCVAEKISALEDPNLDERVRSILRAGLSIDLHSHAGRVIPGRSGNFERPFEPVREPMREGGMNVICLAVVGDTPVTRVNADRTISAVREPGAGELYAWSQRSFPRALELIAQERLLQVVDRPSLEKARSAGPAVILACEGADFLEGRIDRLDEYYETFGLRHLQLTHYRVSEIGDIQTVPLVHDGLTPFGEALVRRCNERGVVVDVAHGPLELVKRAAEVSVKPLVLSHTSLAAVPRTYSRLISPEHARVVAGTGGVIGVWPPASRFPTMMALAGGIAALADVVGIDHVGLGTDMLGLTGPSVFGSYQDLPALVSELLARGFTSAEIGQIIGGNYARVFDASMAA